MSKYQVKLLLVFLLALSTGPAMGANEEEHDHTPIPPFSDGRWQSIAGNGEHFDLTALYLPFHEEESMDLYLFLADWETNAPVPEASIELTVTGANFRETLRVEPLEEAGLYRASVVVPEHGRYSILADISAGGGYDLLSLSGFEPGGHSVAAEESGGGQNGPNLNLFALLAVAVVCGLGGIFIGTRAVRGNPQAREVR